MVNHDHEIDHGSIEGKTHYYWSEDGCCDDARELDDWESGVRPDVGLPLVNQRTRIRSRHRHEGTPLRVPNEDEAGHACSLTRSARFQPQKEAHSPN